MIPYIPTPGFQIGDMRLDAWMILVVLGILAAIEFNRARAIRLGLSVKVTVDAGLVAVASGFLGAHLVHILAYNFPTFVENPETILPWYGGFSSIGGFLGAAIGIPLFLKLKKVPAWAYADNLCIGFVLAWFLGRTGCFMAHDHKGELTDFFLAVDFPGGARHDLGLYEATFVLFLLVTFIYLDRRREWFHGFFTGLVMVLYAPVRFGLDFLRATDLESTINRRSDIRLLGLTPAQYGAIGLLVLGILILTVRSKKGRQDTTDEALRDRPRKKKKEVPAEVIEASSEESNPPADDAKEPDHSDSKS